MKKLFLFLSFLLFVSRADCFFRLNCFYLFPESEPKSGGSLEQSRTFKEKSEINSKLSELYRLYVKNKDYEKIFEYQLKLCRNSCKSDLSEEEIRQITTRSYDKLLGFLFGKCNRGGKCLEEAEGMLYKAIDYCLEGTGFTYKSNIEEITEYIYEEILSKWAAFLSYKKEFEKPEKIYTALISLTENGVHAKVDYYKKLIELYKKSGDSEKLEKAINLVLEYLNAELESAKHKAFLEQYIGEFERMKPSGSDNPEEDLLSKLNDLL